MPLALPPPLADPHEPLDRDQARLMFSTLGEHARACGVALRAPPAEPDSCCGRGCNGCVWESYYAAAACWRQDAWLALQAPAAA